MSSFGRYFRGLTAFDLLGNLVPGVVVLVGILGFVHVDIPELGIAGIGFTIVCAFALGGFIQGHASSVTGERETFKLTIQTAGKPSSKLQSDSQKSADEDGDENENDDQEEAMGRIEWASNGLAEWRPWYTSGFLDPLIGWAAPPRGDELDDVVLTSTIRQHLLDTYEIPKDFADFQVLYHLMFSRVDGPGASGRAVRMQALRNFYRGLWIALWWFSIFVLLAVLLDACFAGPGQSCLAFWPLDQPGESIVWTYNIPNFRATWGQFWQLLPVSWLLLFLSKRRYESQEEDFIEYLFTDYATTMNMEETTVDFSTSAEIGLNHAIGHSTAKKSDFSGIDDGTDSNEGGS